MKRLLSSFTVAAGLFAFSGTANASIIDFTNDSAFGVGITVVNATTLAGTAAGGWTGVAGGGPLNFSEAGPGPGFGPLAGDNDGLGIGLRDDEITYPLESFTITFENVVTIVGLHFLDHFSPEEVRVSVDGTPQPAFLSTLPRPGIGYTAFTGLSLTGEVFVFTVGEPNEIGLPDYALAAIDLAPIPLPAGLLLLGGALGALGVARRRKTA